MIKVFVLTLSIIAVVMAIISLIINISVQIRIRRLWKKWNE